MPIYLVLGRDAAGKSRTAKIKADSPEHARARAAQNGITAETIAIDTADASLPAATPNVAAATPAVAERPAARAVQTYALRLEQGHQAGAPVMNIATPRRGSSLGIASIILGVLAFLICWIPLVNIISLPLSGLGLVLGIAGIIVAMSRRGSSIGLPIAGGAVSLLALVVAGVMWLAIASPGIMKAREAAAAVEAQRNAPAVPPAAVKSPEPEAPKPAPVVAAPAEAPASPKLPTVPAKPAGPVVITAPNVARVGTLEISVVSAKVGNVPLRDIIRSEDSESADVLLRVELKITNRSSSKKHEVITFGARSGIGASRTTYARIVDNFDNTYRAQRFEATSRVIGHENLLRIYPGESAVDVLVFDRPVKTAAHLDLVLDKANLESPTDLTIRIPASMIQW